METKIEYDQRPFQGTQIKAILIYFFHHVKCDIDICETPQLFSSLTLEGHVPQCDWALCLEYVHYSRSKVNMIVRAVLESLDWHMKLDIDPL